jgi:predicted metal-dependent hydrolase
MSSLLQTIQLNDTLYAVILTRRKNSRSFTLRIKHAALELHISAPSNARKKDIVQFFLQSLPTIEKHIKRYPAPTIIYIEEETTLPLLGNMKRLSFVQKSSNDIFHIAYHHGSVSRTILKALQHHFLEYVDYVIAELLKKPDFEHLSKPHITLKDTRSRWGSCAPRQLRIMLSWRLLFAPLHVAHSVIVHEMAHCVHANHSHAFWQLVAAYDPDYERSNAWLKTHGKTLFAYHLKT